jgi:multicomponent Na+:H+ antiporter subunit B
MPDHLVLRVVCKIALPAILMFAMYVQGHGEISPGGGFQAGVIFASAFVLYALIFGIRRAREVAPEPVVERLVAGGVLIYAGVGVATLLLGGRFLDYDVLMKSQVAGQHLGIMLVEIGVGVTVASVMVTIFFTFADVLPKRADVHEDGP